MLLSYTAFVVVVLFLRRFETLMDHLPGTAALQLVVLFLISGSITETLAWLNNYWKAAPQPALEFHPQLFAHLIVGIGFYGGWAVAWLIMFHWFRFTLLEVFLVTGFLGIGFEQLGAVFLIWFGIRGESGSVAAFWRLRLSRVWVSGRLGHWPVAAPI